MAEVREVAEHAAREAGRLIADYFSRGVTMRSKGVADLVSDADVHAERRIVEIIHSAFPDHSVLGEEEN
ncbi:MAG: hypothetical protein KDA96_28035, partial [Planctomycetaceae bacterium]|nr:hypothetical protein [Planctomycetaceae bacterium]